MTTSNQALELSVISTHGSQVLGYLTKECILKTRGIDLFFNSPNTFLVYKEDDGRAIMTKYRIFLDSQGDASLGPILRVFEHVGDTDSVNPDVYFIVSCLAKSDFNIQRLEHVAGEGGAFEEISTFYRLVQLAGAPPDFLRTPITTLQLSHNWSVIQEEERCDAAYQSFRAGLVIHALILNGDITGNATLQAGPVAVDVIESATGCIARFDNSGGN